MNKTAETLLFKRTSFRERGGFSNHVTFFPVREIEITKQFVVLKVGSTRFRYKWSEIKSAVLKHSTVWRGRGRYAQVKIKTRLFILVAPGKTFKFDLSKQFSDFKDKNKLLDELTRHLNVVEEYYEVVSDKFKWLFPVFLVFLIIFAKILNISTPVFSLLFLILLYLSTMELRRKVLSK